MPTIHFERLTAPSLESFAAHVVQRSAHPGRPLVQTHYEASSDSDGAPCIVTGWGWDCEIFEARLYGHTLEEVDQAVAARYEREEARRRKELRRLRKSFAEGMAALIILPVVFVLMHQNGMLL